MLESVDSTGYASADTSEASATDRRRRIPSCRRWCAGASRCSDTEIRPPPDFAGKTFDDFMQLGMIMTALPAMNAIPAVCAAPPGIRTYADLRRITGSGFVSA